MRWSKLGAPLYFINMVLYVVFLITLNVTVYLSPAPFMISTVNGTVCVTGEVALKKIDDASAEGSTCYSCPSLNYLSILLIVLSTIRKLI